MRRYLHRMKRTSSRSGPSQRQLRVGETIRRAVTDMLMRGDLFDPDLANASITVSEAQPSPDLRHVTLYVSVLGGRDEEKVLEALRRNAKLIKREALNGMPMKFTPDIHFQIDRTFDRMDAANRMFSDPKVRRDVESRDEGDGA